MLRPCDEGEPSCRVREFRDEVTGQMDVDALWDQLGNPSLEVLFRDTRVDQQDPHDPIKSETTLNRSYLKKYTPTFGHNRVRINKFTDSGSIWMPFPTKSSEDVTFLSLLHNED